MVSRRGAGCRASRRRPTAAPPSPAGRARRAGAAPAGVITPRSSAITRQPAERALDRPEELAPGPAPPAAAPRGLVRRRDRPVGDEAAEVVDARRGRRARPRAESARSTSGSPSSGAPASRRAGCPSAGRSRSARPAARPRPRRAGRAPATPRGRRRRRRRRSARRRSGGRRGRARRRAARPTRARSAPAPRSRPGPAKRAHSPTQNGCRATKSSISAADTGAVRLGEQARPGGERRARAVRRAELVRRPEREHLPPRLPRRLEPVDEAVRLPAEPAAGQRGRVQEDPRWSAAASRRRTLQTRSGSRIVKT